MKGITLENLRKFINWQRIKLRNKEQVKEKTVAKWEKNGRTIPPPHAVKQKVINSFRQKFSAQVLVETGTFQGEMVYAQRNNFEKIYSIELSHELFETAKKRLKAFPNIELLEGDSGKILKDLIKKINIPALFWLDGHYSGFETAKADVETPVMQELEIIFSSTAEHVILIDDARLFNGQNDYPQIDELEKFVLQKKSNYKFAVEDDIIRIYPEA